MPTSDWDLGQKLIEQGSCSIDQVREILSLQDRMRKMGAAPKPFARVLLEKGYVRREQLLKAGVKESELPPPVEEKAAGVPAPAVGSGARPWIVGAVALAALGGLIFAARSGLFAGPAPDSHPVVSAEDRDAAAREE